MDKTILTCKWFKRGGEKSVWGELGCGVLSLREMMVRYKKTENFSAKLLWGNGYEGFLVRNIVFGVRF